MFLQPVSVHVKKTKPAAETRVPNHAILTSAIHQHTPHPVRSGMRIECVCSSKLPKANSLAARSCKFLHRVMNL